MRVTIVETKQHVYDVAETDPVQAACTARREHIAKFGGEGTVSERWYETATVAGEALEGESMYTDIDLDKATQEHVYEGTAAGGQV